MNVEFELALNASFKCRLMRNYKGMKTFTIWTTITQYSNCVTSVSGRSTNLGFRFKNKGDPETLGWILKHLSEINKEVECYPFKSI